MIVILGLSYCVGILCAPTVVESVQPSPHPTFLADAAAITRRDSVLKHTTDKVVRERSIDSVIGDLTGSRLLDCDGNGLADSIDIKSGTADDTNHNGVIDVCDPDVTVSDLANRDTSWFRFSEVHPKKSFLATSFQPDETIRIRYTVPSPGGRVEVDALDARRHRVRRLTKLARQGPGHYEFRWDRLDTKGRLLPGGRYFIRLRALGRESIRPVQWQ